MRQGRPHAAREKLTRPVTGPPLAPASLLDSKGLEPPVFRPLQNVGPRLHRIYFEGWVKTGLGGHPLRSRSQVQM